MCKSKFFASLLLFLLFGAMATVASPPPVNPSNGTVVLSVGTGNVNIVTDQICQFVIVRENTDAPTAVFYITLAGTTTPIKIPSGSQFQIASPINQPFAAGATIATISATASGPFSFVAIESAGPPSLIVKSSGTSGGGSGLPTLPTSPNGVAYALTSTPSGGVGGAATWTSFSSLAASLSAFPETVSGTVTSGGIPYFSSATQMSSSGVLTAGHVLLGGGAGSAPTADSKLDDGITSANILTYTGSGGLAITGAGISTPSLALSGGPYFMHSNTPGDFFSVVCSTCQQNFVFGTTTYYQMGTNTFAPGIDNALPLGFSAADRWSQLYLGGAVQWGNGTTSDVMVSRASAGLLSVDSTSVGNGQGNVQALSIALGKAGTSAGSEVFNNATSGSITVNPPTGALGSVTLTLPDTNGTILITGSSPTTGHCGQWNGTYILNDSGAPCGSVTTTGSPASGNLSKFSGTTSVTNADLSGDVTTSGAVATTVAKLQGTTLTLTSAAQGQGLTVNSSGVIVNAYPGVTLDTQSGATYTVKGDGSGSDRLAVVNTSNNTTSTAVTVPQAGSSGFASSFGFGACNTGSVVATYTPTTSTVNGNATLKLLGQPSGGNPECSLWYSDGTNYTAAEILPTDANGRLAVSALPAFSGGDVTSSAGSATLTVNSSTFLKIVCSGTLALGTSAIASGARATNTFTCTGLATTDDILADFNADTNAVTGYAPSTNGGIQLKKWVSTNTINVDQINNTAASITPGAVTVNLMGVHHP